MLFLKLNFWPTVLTVESVLRAYVCCLSVICRRLSVMHVLWLNGMFCWKTV